MIRLPIHLAGRLASCLGAVTFALCVAATINPASSQDSNGQGRPGIANADKPSANVFFVLGGPAVSSFEGGTEEARFSIPAEYISRRHLLAGGTVDSIWPAFDIETATAAGGSFPEPFEVKSILPTRVDLVLNTTKVRVWSSAISRSVARNYDENGEQTFGLRRLKEKAPSINASPRATFVSAPEDRPQTLFRCQASCIGDLYIAENISITVIFASARLSEWRDVREKALALVAGWRVK